MWSCHAAVWSLTNEAVDVVAQRAYGRCACSVLALGAVCRSVGGGTKLCGPLTWVHHSVGNWRVPQSCNLAQLPCSR